MTSGAHKATADVGGRSVKEVPSFPREETRAGEPSQAPPQAGPLPASATVPPHNELLFSILESRDCSSLRFGLC